MDTHTKKKSQSNRINENSKKKQKKTNKRKNGASQHRGRSLTNAVDGPFWRESATIESKKIPSSHTHTHTHTHTWACTEQKKNATRNFFLISFALDAASIAFLETQRRSRRTVPGSGTSLFWWLSSFFVFFFALVFLGQRLYLTKTQL